MRGNKKDPKLQAVSDERVKSNKRKGGTKSKHDTPRAERFRDRDPQNVKNIGDLAQNDLSDYSAYPELLSAASAIPFPWRPGMVMPPVRMVYASNDYHDERLVVPGVMRLDYAYSVGWSDNYSSPAAIAARKMFEKIRQSFSGTIQQDAADLIMYVLGLDQLHAFIAYIKRIYRTLNMATGYNYNYPYALLAGMGVDQAHASKLLSQKMRFWGVINNLVRLSNRYFVPSKDFRLFNRHRWMNEGVYMDQPRVDSQTFIFNPVYFWQVYEDPETGTSLIVKPTEAIWSDATLSDPVGAIESYGLELYNGMASWHDAPVIDGYLRRAYEGSSVYFSELIGIDETQSYAYTPEVNDQIENWECLGDYDPAMSFLTGWGVRQDPSSTDYGGKILHTPIWNSIGPHLENGHLLNLYVQEENRMPDAGMVVIGTRMKPCLKVNSDGNAEVHGGSEIPIDARIYRWNGDGLVEDRFNQYIVVAGGSMSLDIKSAIDMIGLRSHFNRAPIAFFGHKLTGAGYGHWVPLMDWKQATFVQDADLEQIHNVCLLSEFGAYSDQKG